MRCDYNKIRNYLREIAIVVCLCSVFTIVNFQQLNAQVTGTETQVIKWLSTSALRSWFSNMGAEIEYGRRDRSTYVAADQIDGLCWPNEFNIRMKGVKCSKGLWIGAKNFPDPVTNITYPYKVVCIGPRQVISGTEIFADDISLLGKFSHPLVFVDDAPASARDYDDIIDKEDNNLAADRVIMNRFHTSLGVSVTRKILSFSQQYNNNYYIYEYTFKNTGIIDESGQKKLNITLQDVVFYMELRSSLAGLSYTGFGTTGAGSWFPTGASYGRNTINDVVGQDAAHTLPSPNNFRADFSFWGPMSTASSPAYDIGLPGPIGAAAVTELGGYQFTGTCVLHADRATNDRADDVTQPKTTMFEGSDNNINVQPSQYNSDLMAQKYLSFMTIGHAAQTQAEQIGKDANGWPTGPGNTFGTDLGGYKSTQGFGPYTLAPGDSIRIVVAEAVAGISWNKACEVAKNWYANNSSAFILPSGYAAQKGYTTAQNANEYKNAWVFSGRDSLFQTFRRAIANYNSNYAIPQPPPPPDKFIVNSGGDRIKISWSSSAEGSANFDGYRLYRSEGKTDTTYDLIFECSKSNATNSYDDQSAKRGSNYYYYIQTKDNGSTNPGNPSLNIPAGEPLVSSRYYTMTNTPAYLTRPAGLALTTVKTFSNVKLIKYMTFITDRRKATDTVTSVSYRVVLPKSILDSAGTTTVRGVRVYCNGDLLIPGLYTVSRDTVRFIKFPGVDIDANLPAHRDTVSSIVDSALAKFLVNNKIDVTIISPVNSHVNALFIGDGVTTKFGLPEPVTDDKGNKLYTIKVSDNSGEILSSLYTINVDTLVFTLAPSRHDTIIVLLSSQVQRSYKLSEIRIVPNPYNIKARNIQFGINDPTTLDRLGFFNLPPLCKIKIYTETGDLIATIDHTNGSGDDYWNSLTSSRQVVVSGLYIAYFEVTENAPGYKKGDSIFKKFIIVR